MSNYVPIGIGPQSLLEEMSKDANIVNLESSWGIHPDILVLAKSNFSKVDISLIDTGICYSNWFLDKFNNYMLFRLPMLLGISLVILLFEASNIVFLSNSYVRLYSTPFM